MTNAPDPVIIGLMQPNRLSRVSILGVGLLGGSLGLAVQSVVSGCTIAGYGHRRSTLETALTTGAVNEVYDEPGPAVRGAELVVLCTPVGLFEGLLREIAPALEPGAVVTDVGSTKRAVVAAAERVLPAGVRFVGSHPMAGSEKRGVEFARADLFRGARCITTPTQRTDAEALAGVEGFWRMLGMQVVRLSPGEHDRLVSDVSHLPHAVAAAVVAVQEDAALGVAGKGFLDATRIAGGDGGLWRDILLDNRDNLRAGVGRLKDKLDELLALLDRGDGEALKAWLDAAAERRRTMAAGRERETSGE